VGFSGDKVFYAREDVAHLAILSLYTVNRLGQND
jgi:hypothetical protein